MAFEINLSEELVADALAAGVPIEATCREALQAAIISAGAVAPEQSGLADDTARYESGRSTGEYWASSLATIEELESIAVFNSARWQDIGIQHRSLVNLLMESGEVDVTADGKAWLPRTPFAEGIVEAAAAAFNR